MSKEITTEMLLEMIEKTGWDIGSRDTIVRVDTIAHNIELQRKIADLEAKLADMIKKYELASLPIGGLVDVARNLEQQLAEKEKEIEKLQHYNDRLAQGIYHSYGEHFVSKIKQDKISFCIEQLEKVRKTIKNLHGQKNVKIGNSYIQKKDKLYNKYIIELDILENVLEIFDNQIEELKKEMK